MISGAVHKILRENWNPIGVPELPDDEYSSYEEGIQRLLGLGAAADELVAYLFVAEFGMFHSEEETLRVAREGVVPPARAEALAPIAEKLLAINAAA